ncbi:MAG: hypothetical protein IBX55_15890 [Methyloprofundus sp.]|nr:hypothetical protein [Methyloprofundus sp.]
MIPSSVSTNSKIALDPIELKIALSIETVAVIVLIVIASLAYGAIRIKNR